MDDRPIRMQDPLRLLESNARRGWEITLRLDGTRHSGQAIAFCEIHIPERVKSNGARMPAFAFGGYDRERQRFYTTDEAILGALRLANEWENAQAGES